MRHRMASHSAAGGEEERHAADDDKCDSGAPAAKRVCTEDDQAADRDPKRKVYIMFGFRGTGYHGLENRKRKRKKKKAFRCISGFLVGLTQACSGRRVRRR